MLRKIVLTIICFMIAGSFIALNYLLWDRENKSNDIISLESEQNSKQSIIEALTKQTQENDNEILMLKNYRNSLLEDIDILNSDIESLKKQHENEREALNQALNKKDETIAEKESLLLEKDSLINRAESAVLLLGKIIDCDKFLGLLKKWGSAVIKQDYNTVYSLQMGINVYDDGAVASIAKIEELYKDKIESVEFISIEPDLTNMDNLFDNEISFVVKANVTFKESFIPDEKAKYPFTNGLNVKTIKFTYNNENNEWYIKQIREPVETETEIEN